MGAQESTSGSVEKRYYLQKVKLGAGSFGTVWRAVDRKTNTIVAIKQMDKSRMTTRGVKKEDVERETNMMKACSHENVLGLYETFEDAKFIYLALEYCGDGDLSDKIRERALRLQEPQAAEWMRQICSAISALHTTGICHRDIKPENFMLAGEELKLADFGLANFLPRGKMLTDKCGTPAFMSPEQHRLPKQSRGYGLPVDVWAAGISLYMLMTGGRHPFFDSRGQLDMKLLMQGSAVMEFSTAPKQEQSWLGQLLEFEDTPQAAPDRRFSDAARELCKMMVQPNPSTRITAEGALRSPWLSRQLPAKPSTGSFGPPQRRPSANESATPSHASAARQQQLLTESAGAGTSSLTQGMNELGVAMAQAATYVSKGISGVLDEPPPRPPTTNSYPAEVSNVQGSELMASAQAFSQERILSQEAANMQLVADVEQLRIQLSRRDDALSQRDAEIAKMHAQQEELQQHLQWQATRSRAREDEQRTASQLENDLARLRQDLAEKEQKLAERDQELADKNDELVQRDTQMAQLENELNDIRSQRRPSDGVSFGKCCLSLRRAGTSRLAREVTQERPQQIKV